MRIAQESESNQKASGLINVETLTWWHHRSRTVFGDYRWTAICLSSPQRVTGVDGGREFFAIEKDWSFGRRKRAELCSAWTAESLPSACRRGGRPHMGPLVHI